MIIYNVTTKVQADIHDAWLNWIKTEHIPGIINTGYFINANVLRLLETDDTDGPTYAVQYIAESKDLYNQYIEHYSIHMRQQSFDKWGDQCISFRSVLQVIN